MRIYVTGDNDAAKLTRASLSRAGFVVAAETPSYHEWSPFAYRLVTIEESQDAAEPEVDGIDCELERRIVQAIAGLSTSGRVLLHRRGGVQSDREIRIVVPANDHDRDAVALGVTRGLAQETRLK
jgi:hypothetical protein